MTGPASTLQWAADQVGVAEQARAAVAQVVANLAPVVVGEGPTFGFEVHHDGSGRVDLSVFRPAEPGRTLRIGDARVSLGTIDVAEYDLEGPEARLAGVFHPVVAGGPPGLPEPLLVAPLTGRQGQVRLILALSDAGLLDEVGRHVTLPTNAPEVFRFLASATSLRLAIDLLPDQRSFGERVGFEVFIDPAVFDVTSGLRALGVDEASIEGMQALADRCPESRRTDAWEEGLGFTHFSVSWAAADEVPVLKSYCMVRSGPAPTREQRRDALVRAEAANWVDRVRRGAQRLPLRRPPADHEELLGQWRDAVDPHLRGGFERRLHRDGLTVASAAAVLLAGSEQTPAWWPTYTRALAAVKQATDAPTDAHSVPFAPLLWRVVIDASARFADDPMVGQAALGDLRLDLLARLSWVCAPVLSHMMWSDVPFGARLAAQFAPPDAEHPRQRFEQFCAHHAADGLTEVLTQFPVLGGAVATTIDQWATATAEMLDRIAADRAALHVRLGVPPDATLDGVSQAGGDQHNDGRSVRVLRFGEVRVVYKPRSVHLEAFFARAATDVSRRCPGVDLGAAKVVDRDAYGYMQHIAYQPATDFAAFYRNAGAVLALLHVLAATDCHQENLIAHGNQLVLIDAETLLTGSAPPASQVVTPVVGEDPATDPVSVLRVGMLPSWLWLDGRRTAVDISALGVAPGGTRRQGQGWRAVNTDAMLRGPIDVAVPHPACLPTPSGVEAPLSHHLDDVIDGFTQVYRVLEAGRQTWLYQLIASAEGGNRAVLRPTYVYASLLADLLAPGAMRSALQRAWILERLTRAYLDDEAEDVWPLVAAEQEALQRGDVPYFQWPLAGGRTTWLAGELSGWPQSSQLDEVLRRLEQLGEPDLALQTALIKASVATAGFTLSSQPDAVDPDREGPPEKDIGRWCFQRVGAAGRHSGGRTQWIGPTLLPDGEHVTVRPIGLGLYDGRLGVALAFALLAVADPIGHGEAAATMADALDPVLDVAADPESASRLLAADGPGLAGMGGLLRGLDLLRATGLVDPDRLLHGERGALSVLSAQRLRADTRLDHMLGVAGLIAPLARREGYEDLVATCAGVLMDAQDARTGAWTTLPGSGLLTGMAHGAAGISLALVEAGVALGESAMIDAAVRGLDYEAGVFDPAAGNWPDLRGTAAGGFMLGWCAGAPGIALARDRVLQLLPDHPRADLWREELRIAAGTTAAMPLLARDHVCCGNAGRVGILRALGGWDEQADALEVSMRRRGAPRTMLQIDTDVLPMPGLFSGLAGIGAVLEAHPGQWVRHLLV